MNKTVAKAPCRVDLFGGTLDLWPLYLYFQPCATANVAISIHTETQLEYKPGGNSIELIHADDSGHEQRTQTTFPLNPRSATDPWKLMVATLDYFARGQQGTFRLRTQSYAPLGSGLAASSSQMVGLVSALNATLGRGLNPLQLQVLARNLESQILHVPAGEQDYFPALFGGVGLISLEPNGLHHRRYAPWEAMIQEQLLVFYTGSSHHSGVTNWGIYQDVINRDAKTCHTLEALAKNSAHAARAMESNDTSALLKGIGQDWQIRKQAFPQLATPLTEKAESILRAHGIEAFRVCGAAAGGCMFALAPPTQHSALKTELTRAGMKLLQATLAPDGVIISH